MTKVLCRCGVREQVSVHGAALLLATTAMIHLRDPDQLERLTAIVSALPAGVTAADLDRLGHEVQRPEFWRALRDKYAAVEEEAAAAARKWREVPV